MKSGQPCGLINDSVFKLSGEVPRGIIAPEIGSVEKLI